MTRPSPRPRPKPVAKLGVVSQKTPSEKLTGQPDEAKPAVKSSAEKLSAQKRITHAGVTFVAEENPVGFAAAVACKSGEGMVTTPHAAVES